MDEISTSKNHSITESDFKCVWIIVELLVQGNVEGMMHGQEWGLRLNVQGEKTQVGLAKES